MPKSYETILVNNDDGVVTLTLNRPEKMNALTGPMMQEITDALEEIDLDESMRVVVITGVGNAFCAGADFGWAGSTDGPGAGLAGERNYRKMVLGLQERLRVFPRPTIAAVNGHALGLGFWLAMLCDFVVASPSARFGIPQIRYTHPNGGSIKSMIEFVPHRWAVYHLLTGEAITPEQAERFDMVNKVVPKEQLLPEAYKLAGVMKEKDPVILRYLKRSIWREKYLSYAEAIDLDNMQSAQVSVVRRAMGVTGPSGLEAMKAQKSKARGR
ncbi:MAG: enoyl-CoA hydratase/isomerase family protein [Chloroflexota bacterium]